MSLKGRILVLATIMAVNGLAAADITSSLGEICGKFRSIVPIVALLMFFAAGAIYAAGQIMGSETRARANVWSTAMLIGGIIGLILAASAQYFVNVFANFSLGSGSGSYGAGTTVSC